MHSLELPWLGNASTFDSDKSGLLRSTCICNALIEMYAKCGCIDPALQLFNQMLERDVISWSTLIGGLVNHGKAREAIKLFQEMQGAGIEPNGITFVGLLSSCTHAGFWNQALRYFPFHQKRMQYGARGQALWLFC